MSVPGYSGGGGIPTSAQGAANGVATLDGTANVPAAQLGNVPGQSLTRTQGHLAADTTINATSTLLMTTAALAVGTWLVSVSVLVKSGVGSATVAEASLATGTATATFDGGASGGTSIPATGEAMIAFTAMVTVTVPGTLLISAIRSATAGPVASAALTQAVFGDATGYTALKVA